MSTYPEHLKPENIIRAFSPNIGAEELAARVRLMKDPKCTKRRISNLLKKYKGTNA